MQRIDVCIKKYYFQAHIPLIGKLLTNAHELTVLLGYGRN